MKKLYFTILSALICFGANAQTLTATNHAPVIGEMYRTTDVSTVGIVPGPSGASSTWDFSAASVGTTVTTFSVVSAASTGSSSSYPSASVAISPTSNNNAFYSYPATDYNYFGGNLQIGTFALVITYNANAPAILAKYPMSLSTTVSNTVAGTLNVSGNNGSFTGNNNTIADGTGTLALPSRTFTNAMRVVNTQTLNAIILGFSVTVTQKIYDYYDIAKSKTSLFSINTSTLFSQIGGTSTQTFVTINTDYQFVGITESVKEVSNLNVYPSPAKSNVTLSFVNANAENASYEINNALGQLVKKENMGNDKGIVKQNINIENLESGIYFIKVVVGNSTSTKKITVQ